MGLTAPFFSYISNVFCSIARDEQIVLILFILRSFGFDVIPSVSDIAPTNSPSMLIL